MIFTPKEIRDSRITALEAVKGFLAVPEVETQFDGRNAGTHSPEKFLVTWKANFRGTIPCEERLDLCDPMYRAYSGYRTIRVSVSLFHEKQLDQFPSVWIGLLKTGLYLSAGRAAMREFFNKYATPYNDALKARQNQSNTPPSP